MAQAPEKSEGAFRTIREVADWLAVPTHVLRFWESKFQQIAPVKGAGGRRYYRPEDMRLLGGIKVMLHDQGVTIRGVSQKIDDEGLAPLMAMSPDLDMSEAPSQRTRRVIRAGEDEDEEDGTHAAPVPIRGAGGGDGNGAERPSDGHRPHVDRMPSQPDVDPMPDQPIDTDSAPQPGDGPVHDAPQPPQPVDRPGPAGPAGPPPDRETSAPSEPVETGPDDDEETDLPAPADEEIGQLGDRSDEDGMDDDEDVSTGDETRDGNVRELDRRVTETPVESVRPPKVPSDPVDTVPTPLGPIARRRLRRVIRKLRGMVEDVEQELSGGVGR